MLLVVAHVLVYGVWAVWLVGVVWFACQWGPVIGPLGLYLVLCDVLLALFPSPYPSPWP